MDKSELPHRLKSWVFKDFFLSLNITKSIEMKSHTLRS